MSRSKSVDVVSDYEQQRLENIARNAEALRQLGLDPIRLTTPAVGKQTALPAKKRRKRMQRAAVVMHNFLRRSARIAKIDATVGAPNYQENEVEDTKQRKLIQSKDTYVSHRRKRKYRTIAQPKKKSQSQRGKRSCRDMKVDIDKLLSKNQLGLHVYAPTTQIKASVMHAASLDGTMPTFSRMSGIQEWENAIMLFVNVYGTSYKNVFLDHGRQITWFAQSRQWEDTPVIRRLIEGCIMLPSAQTTTASKTKEKNNSQSKKSDEKPGADEQKASPKKGDDATGFANKTQLGNNEDKSCVDGKSIHAKCVKEEDACESDDENSEVTLDPVRPAHVLLFCRGYQQEYVCCGM